jgi:hypothetical protein
MPNVENGIVTKEGEAFVDEEKQEVKIRQEPNKYVKEARTLVKNGNFAKAFAAVV